MEKARVTNKMDGKYNHEDLNALVGYIQELEISLAKKDQELAAKDQRIGTLETEACVMKVDKEAAAAPVFRVKATDEAVTPRALPGRDQSASSTPNQVSDDSGEILQEESGESFSHSLSHISQVQSSDSDEDSTPEHADGRWNIPFDGSFEDLVAKSPWIKGAGHENALMEIGFVPICKEGRGRYSVGTAVTPLRPVARRSLGASPSAQAVRRGLSKDNLNGKENVSPKRNHSLEFSALSDIR